MTGSSDALRGALPRLHLVTDDAIIRRSGFTDVAAELMRSLGGRIALHLRGRALSGRELFDAAIVCAAIARETGTLLVINDRVDVALCCGAPAIQLPRLSLTVRDARRLVGADIAIGASVHSIGEADRSISEGADFLLAGTVFPTPSHPDAPGSGTVWLADLVELGKPVIAIGGITAERVGEVMDAGAYGVAVMRAVWGAEDPAGAATELLRSAGAVRPTG